MKTLLVPLDFSDACTEVLREAAGLAEVLSARIVLLHVIEPAATHVPVGASMDLLTIAPAAMVQPSDVTGDEAKLESLAHELRSRGVVVECAAVVGLAVDEIVARAAQENANFIVLGSHGHGALYHLFGGSVVTGVLRRAACPVVVVPARKAK